MRLPGVEHISVAGTIIGICSLVSITLPVSSASADTGGAGPITEYNLLALRKPGSGIPLLDGSLGDPLPSPGQMAFASDGKLYIMEGTFDAGYQVGQFDPQTHEFNELVTPTPLSSPCDLNTEKPGVVIFGEFTGNRIGSFHVPDLGVTPFPL
jgi:hypothetical protein